MKRTWLLACMLLAGACGVPVGDASYIETSFESGAASEWQDKGGAVYTEFTASLAVVSERAHRGKHAAKITLPGNTGSVEHGAFGFNGNLADGAYYSASYFIPERYAIKTTWTLLEFRGVLPGGLGNPDDVQWALAVQNRTDGEMVLRLWNQMPAGPMQIESNADAPVLPVGRWVHLEGYWKKGTAGDGRVTFWQDGQMVFDRPNVTTVRVPEAMYWEATSFADQLTATVYIDDVMSTSVRMWPLLSGD